MTGQRLLVSLPALAPLLAPHFGDGITLISPPPGADLATWLGEQGSGIRVAIAGGYEMFDDGLFRQLPDLRHLVIFGEGMEGIDRKAAARCDVTLSNAAGMHAPEVANHAVALMLAARRRLLECDSWVRDGRWLEARMPLTPAVVGARVGIVGLGQIGTAIAQRVAALGCEVFWWGPRDKPKARWPRSDSLIALAAASDILVVAVRADEETRRLIVRPVLDALGCNGMLVNISRGFVVDELELIAALREGRLGQAALDVFDPEPTSPERWANVPNLLLSPHQGGATIETIDALVAHAAARARAALAAN